MAETTTTGRRTTAQTRVWEEQAEKLGWLWRLKGILAANFIGPRIEKDLDAEFESIRPLVEQLKAEEAAKSELAAAHSPDLGESGA
jgi:hypothetical protein